ncbi:MAG: hypothetical protein EBS33_04955, partial [Alphaproteobacteria bacterium]|nr:hypothetical protein [Alphaproteobacteria bacterium]
MKYTILSLTSIYLSFCRFTLPLRVNFCKATIYSPLFAVTTSLLSFFMAFKLPGISILVIDFLLSSQDIRSKDPASFDKEINELETISGTKYSEYFAFPVEN